MTCSIEHRRAAGDTLAKLSMTLQNDGVARNLTGLTVTFFMVDYQGNVIINDAAATVLSATDGTVEYDFTAPQVAVPGDYYAWFKVLGGVGGIEPDHYPDDEDGIHVLIFDPTPTHTTPDPSILTATEVANLARAPLRTRTVEGMVQERTVDELIKAANYTAQQNANSAVPWGMRIAKSKPPSTLS